ncbi:MAG: hypothetical protein M1820_004327 [Bogoriella megaspora]|nr:MAG: hypothetical protein M1820_004327 [Bogoriella megaspora]
MVEIPTYLNKLIRKRSDSADSGLIGALPDAKRQKNGIDATSDTPLREAGIPKSTPVAQTQNREKGSKTKHKGQARAATGRDETQGKQAPPDCQHTSSSPKLEKAPQRQPSTSSDTILNMNSSADSLNKTVQTVINQEILFKHRELRLIEQELAKCQIALEQVRRCRIIPFPGYQSLSEEVSTGTGPALEPQIGFTRPQYAAPWGVTDGPYTRHYAKWLIPDPSFDPISQQQLQAYNQPFTPNVEGRSLRNGPVTADPRQSIGGKGRLSRISTGANLQSIPTEYPTPKKDGPLIIKRASDNQFVKLVCTDCNRGNFSSAQGFLNHCRIAHHKDYKSHEAAAQACGQLLDPNEIATPMETQQPNPIAPPLSATATNTHLVHPYIMAEPPSDLRAASSVARKPGNRPNKDRSSQPAVGSPLATNGGGIQASTALVSNPSDHPNQGFSISFAPSPSTPHLSRILQRKGFNGDVADLVAKAQTKVEIESDPEDSGDESEQVTPTEPAPRSSLATVRHTTAGGVRPLSRAGVSPVPLERPSSRKGHRQPPSNGRLHVQSAAPSRHVNGVPPRLAQLPHAREIPETPELSPHTLESNPGLVSDRGEDEDEEDAKSEHHPDTEGNVRVRDSNGHLKFVDVEMDLEDGHPSDRELEGPRPKARKTELGQSSKAGRRGGR